MKHILALLLAVCWSTVWANAASSPTGTVNPDCPPSWHGTILKFRGILHAGSQECQFKDLMTTCDPDQGSSCRPNDSNFVCCGKASLPAIRNCVKDNTKGLCIPKDLSKYMAAIMAALG